MLHAREDYNRIQDPAGLIPEDEPVFLIRGQDVNGPATLLFWARLAEKAGADPEIVRRAREHADRMGFWQDTRNASKVPDL
jgi:hypothetical protein